MALHGDAKIFGFTLRQRVQIVEPIGEHQERKLFNGLLRQFRWPFLEDSSE